MILPNSDALSTATPHEAMLVPIVTQSHIGFHDRPIENSTHKLAKLSLLFPAFCFLFKITKLVPQNITYHGLCS